MSGRHAPNIPAATRRGTVAALSRDSEFRCGESEETVHFGENRILLLGEIADRNGDGVEKKVGDDASRRPLGWGAVYTDECS